MNDLVFKIKCVRCGNEGEIKGKIGEIGSYATSKVSSNFEITSPTTLDKVSLICKNCGAFTVITN